MVAILRLIKFACKETTWELLFGNSKLLTFPRNIYNAIICNANLIRERAPWDSTKTVKDLSTHIPTHPSILRAWNCLCSFLNSYYICSVISDKQMKFQPLNN